MLSSIITMLNMLALVSLPGYLVAVVFSFIFWGIPIRPWLDRIIFFICTQALFVSWMYFHLRSGYFSAISLASLTLLFLFFFQPIRLADRTRLIVICLLIVFATEMTSRLFRLHHLSKEQMISNSFLLLSSLWPLYATIGILSLFMAWKKVHPGKHIHHFLTAQRRNTISYLILLLIVQFLLLIFLLPIFPIRENSLYFSLIFLASILSLTVILLALKVMIQSVDEGARISQSLYIEDVNRMFTAIRGQRHDFLNHVQVILSMVRRSKYSELERYTSELAGEVTEINEVLQIGHPAVAALVRSKMAAALAEKVEFRYQLFGLDNLSLGIKSIDVVKIIGNLIDNALDEVSRLPIEKRWIELNSQMEDGLLLISVRNPGKKIPEEDMHRIFNPGYTTKNSNNHSGIGLSIVKERVEHYKGNVGVESCAQKGTEFRIEIPVANPS